MPVLFGQDGALAAKVPEDKIYDPGEVLICQEELQR